MKIATRILLLITGVLSGLIAAGIILLLSARPRGKQVNLQPPPTPSPLRVHVIGAVAEPGVYSLPPHSIVEDAILAAGGYLPDADLQNINLAAPILDGQQIYIHAEQEIVSTPNAAESSVTNPTTKMNVNTAKAPQLETLPGIGPSLAQEIIQHRQQNGPFQSIEDLLNVSGIGPAKLEQMREFIVVR
jgi:competence protein ComEA